MTTTRNTAELRQIVEQHVAADAVIQGIYWDGQRGCFIGCLNHCNSPAHAEAHHGLPIMVQRIAEAIFERLPAEEARQFFAALPDAVGCDGKDLSRVGWQFMAQLLRRMPPQPAEIQAVVDLVIAGLQLLAAGKKWPANAAAAAAAANAAAADAAVNAAAAADDADVAVYAAAAAAADVAVYAAAAAADDADVAVYAAAAAAADVAVYAAAAAAADADVAVYAAAAAAADVAVYAAAAADADVAVYAAAAAANADVAVYAAAAAAADADVDAARHASLAAQRDLLLELISAAPVIESP